MKLRAEFNEKNKVSTGGVTGSARVVGVADGKYYQLKPSILDNSKIRRLKVKSKDRENFGEVIASYIGIALLGKGIVPEVSLVYDRDSSNKRVLIASKYLEGDSVRDLDAYARERGFVFPDGKHVEIIPGAQSDRSQGKMAIDGIDPLINKKSLAEALVLSAIVGDHDVNPGNMIVATREGVSTISRIDFGHAFNDLLHAPEIMGGRVRDDNYVMDFFNREKVAGLGGDRSKLWRDHAGMIPSQEIATALDQLGSTASEQVHNAIEEVRLEFQNLLLAMRNNNDSAGREHVVKSLVAVHKNFSSEEFVSTHNISHDVNLVFTQLETYINNNLKGARDASRIMQLQVNIDNALKARVPVETILEEAVPHFKEAFPNAINHEESVQWIKLERDLPAFPGNLQDYVIHRHLELLKKSDHIKTPHEEISTKIYDFVQAFTSRTFQKKEALYTNFLIKNGLQGVLVELNKGDFNAASELAANLQSRLSKEEVGSMSLGRTSKAFKEVISIQQGLEEMARRESHKISPLAASGNHPMKNRIVNDRPQKEDEFHDLGTGEDIHI